MDLIGAGKILNGLMVPSKLSRPNRNKNKGQECISMQEKAQIIIDDSEEFRKFKEELRATKMVTSFGIKAVLAESIDKRLEKSDHESRSRRGSLASTKSAPEKAAQNEPSIMKNHPRRASNSMLFDKILPQASFRRLSKEGVQIRSYLVKLSESGETRNVRDDAMKDGQQKRRGSSSIFDSLLSSPSFSRRSSYQRESKRSSFSVDMLQKLMINLEEETNRRSITVQKNLFQR